MAEIVILAPHFDDAVLNCWHALVNSNSTVMTVFSGIPSKGTHRFWDFVCGEADSHKMMHERRHENEIAVAISNTDRPQLYLDFLDNQYRSTSLLVNNIVKDVLEKSPKNCSFLVPLAASAIYRHPDHILVRKVGVGLYKLGRNVSFYPDSPYTTLPRRANQNSIARIKKSAEKTLGISISIELNKLSNDQQIRKRQAMRAYRTQYTATNLNSFGGLGRIARRDYEVTIKPN
jgi:LmbE family N-acetylglucosaminyl deacetylase